MEPRMIVALVAAVAGSLSASASTFTHQPADPPVRRVWLPYGFGIPALCGQGPNSAGTHKGIFAWDFVLDEGRPVVSAADGRVFWVVDDRQVTGSNSFADSNHIFIDHGDSTFSTYTHHKTGTARVRPGQVVATGSVLADVGKVGTVTSHIHFDLRGPSWHQTHEVRFRTGPSEEKRLQEGQTYTSGTPAARQPSPTFADSVLRGDEFAANGVSLKGGSKAFWLPNGEHIVIEGQTTRQATQVGFYIWPEGGNTEYAVTAVPDGQGRFRLTAHIPRAIEGPRWYRIAIQEASGRLSDTATVPAMVTSNLPR